VRPLSAPPSGIEKPGRLGLALEAFLEASADVLAKVEDARITNPVESSLAVLAAGEDARLRQGLQVPRDIGLGGAKGLGQVADILPKQCVNQFCS
jgi:hypothetical protein